MPSSQSHFQPPPPIRTNTSGSQKSVSSGAMSPDMASPSSTFSRGGRSLASPTEESFFGAIATRVRKARSRSRSRHAGSRRSKSPYQMPPEHLPPTSTAQPTSPIYASVRPQQQRHTTGASRTSTSSASGKAQRPWPTVEGVQRRSTSGSDMWRGRHSNSWLFNDFSVTETANKVFHLGQRKD